MHQFSNDPLYAAYICAVGIIWRLRDACPLRWRHPLQWLWDVTGWKSKKVRQ